MTELLYHGSESVVGRPIYGKGAKTNDPEYSVLNWLAILADNRTYWQNSSIAEEAKK